MTIVFIALFNIIIYYRVQQTNKHEKVIGATL